MAAPKSTSASVREQKLARVIDREVAPIWHDRFARLLLRELPSDPETFALDVHSGPGHTTAELLHRLDESSRIVALGRDPWLMQVSKTRVRPEWKRRVYFKAGDIDDVTGMNDDTYNLAVANLVLGEQVVEWQPALAELVRVTKPGGQVLATLPLFGTWREVENMFEEMLRDEGMRREVGTLQQLRRRRPKPTQIVEGLRAIGLSDHDYVVEHERFELLFRSGREFLFAPVIEHGPLRLWKAIIGRAEKPQALFWRFKETIDTYYADHVLAVSVMAGLVRIRVPGGEPNGSFAGAYWSRYPSLSRVWGGPGADAPAEASEDDFEFDLDIDLDEAEAAIDALGSGPMPAATSAPPREASSFDLDISGMDDVGSGFADASDGFADIEVSSVAQLPAVEDASLSADQGDDPFAGLLDELDAEVDAIQPRVHAISGKAATLGAVEHSPLPGKLPARPSTDSSPTLAKTRSGESGASPLPGKLPPKPASAAGKSGSLPKLPKLKTGESGKLKLPPRKPGKLSDRLPRRTSSGATPIPPGFADVDADNEKEQAPEVVPPGQGQRKDPKSLLARLPKRDKTIVGRPPLPPPPAGIKPGPAPSIKPPAPQVTRPGEEDPFASMLEDDEEDELEEIDELEVLPEDALLDSMTDDDDFADSFGDVGRPVPPPPPRPAKKKKP